MTKKTSLGREKSITYPLIFQNDSRSGGISTAPSAKNLAESRLLGFVGPVPPPLWIRADAIFNLPPSIAQGWSQDASLLGVLNQANDRRWIDQDTASV